MSPPTAAIRLATAATSASASTTRFVAPALAAAVSVTPAGKKAKSKVNYAAAVSAAGVKTAYTGSPVTSPLQARLFHSTPSRLAAGPSDPDAVPDFSAYKRSGGDQDADRAAAYVMVGALGAVSAVGIKASVVDFLANLSASADVLALAKVEVDLTTIPEGKNVVLKWRGKPVFIRHRTPEDIEEANNVNLAELRHPETDAERVKKPEWLIQLGVCTHLGCVPIDNSGDYKAWFCPCHGSHYDISGRIRKGPAPLNLEIPPYEFIDNDTKVVIG